MFPYQPRYDDLVRTPDSEIRKGDASTFTTLADELARDTRCPMVGSPATLAERKLDELAPAARSARV
jgi:hypothetical protein